MENEWKEKHEGIVTLEEEDHVSFQHFMLWLYSGKVFDGDGDETMESVEMIQLLDCYFLADRRDVPAMQNYIIDIILSKSQRENTVLCSS